MAPLVADPPTYLNPHHLTGRCLQRWVHDYDYHRHHRSQQALDPYSGTLNHPAPHKIAKAHLVERVWAETKARNKPSDPPNLTEGQCGQDVLGCYLASNHTIRLTTGFTLRTLLHELAHVLISGDAAMATCGDDWTHRQLACSHGPLYRCAADALYVRYAGLKSAGVCGMPPDIEPGDWHLSEPFETEWGVSSTPSRAFSTRAATTTCLCAATAISAPKVAGWKWASSCRATLTATSCG